MGQRSRKGYSQQKSLQPYLERCCVLHSDLILRVYFARDFEIRDIVISSLICRCLGFPIATENVRTITTKILQVEALREKKHSHERVLYKPFYYYAISYYWCSLL